MTTTFTVICKPPWNEKSGPRKRSWRCLAMAESMSCLGASWL